MYVVHRFAENPLITPDLHPEIGTNINGPSLIRVPEWITDPLGGYYLYFAHHQGTFIRLAYADDLHGPWRYHEGGVLGLEDTCCERHIASPDVHVIRETRQLVMYFHGPTGNGQRSFRSTSRDGLTFQAEKEVLGSPYLRVFRHDDAWYGMLLGRGPEGVRGGIVVRSEDGVRDFDRGRWMHPGLRHLALLNQDDLLRIFFSRVGDRPERILVSTLRLDGDWRTWVASEPEELLQPEMDYEGDDLLLARSRGGAIRERVRQLRDPAVFEEDGRVYLLYSGAGESNICAAELVGL